MWSRLLFLGAGVNPRFCGIKTLKQGAAYIKGTHNKKGVQDGKQRKVFEGRNRAVAIYHAKGSSAGVAMVILLGHDSKTRYQFMWIEKGGDVMNKVYKIISGLVSARLNCIKTNNHAWKDRHEDRIDTIIKDRFPSGSGFDAGTKIDYEESTSEKLVFISSYHMMDEYGGYDGWIDFKVIVTASLQFDFDLRIKGRFSKLNDHNSGLRDYIEDTFHFILNDMMID
jgi:hypothetical protein